MTETQVEKIARILKIPIEEAQKVIDDDKRIDKGEKLFELSTEGKAVEKNMKNTHTRQTKDAYGNKRTVTRKEDNDKSELVKMIYCALCNNDSEKFGPVPDIKITNPEREIELIFNSRKFKITLSAPRKPKEKEV